jgi:hypothetical protein
VPAIQLIFTNVCFFLFSQNTNEQLTFWFRQLYLGIAQGALAKAAEYTVKNTRPWPYAGDVKERAVDEFYIQEIYGDLQVSDKTSFPPTPLKPVYMRGDEKSGGLITNNRDSRKSGASRPKRTGPANWSRVSCTSTTASRSQPSIVGKCRCAWRLLSNALSTSVSK